MSSDGGLVLSPITYCTTAHQLGSDRQHGAGIMTNHGVSLDVQETVPPADVRRVLHRAARTEIRSLDVTVRDGAVTLRGHVSSYYEKQLALQRAQGLSGVRHVEDRVPVSRLSAGAEGRA